MDGLPTSEELLIIAKNQQIQRGPLTAEQAQKAFKLAFEALADSKSEIVRLRTEIARLKAQIDAYEGREVKFGMERWIMASLSDGVIAPEKDGTLLRATDTGKEWECQGGEWRVRPPA